MTVTPDMHELLTGPERKDRRFSTMKPEGIKAWWEETQSRSNAMIAMQGGLQIYVSEPYSELAHQDAALAFVRVHVVSSTKPAHDEFERVVNIPTLDRLIPVASIAAIAPVVEGMDL